MTNSPEMRALDPLAPDVAFDAWVNTLDPKHWAKYDLSACLLGWNAALASSAPHAQGDVAGLDNPLLPNKVLDDNYARALMADGASGNMSMDTSVAMALIAEVRNARRGSLPRSDGAVAEPAAFMKNGIPYSPIRFPGPWRADPAAYGLTPLFDSPINPVAAGVKELEWVNDANSGENISIYAKGFPRFYQIWRNGADGPIAVWSQGNFRTDVATITEAKAAAQADYETRIRSALILRQAPDAEQGESSEGARRNETTTKGACR